MTSSGTVCLGHFTRLCGSNTLSRAKREFNNFVHYVGHFVSTSIVQLKSLERLPKLQHIARRAHEGEILLEVHEIINDCEWCCT